MFTMAASARRSGESPGTAETNSQPEARRASRGFAKTILRMGLGVAVAAWIQWRNSQLDPQDVAPSAKATAFVAVDNQSQIYKNDEFLSSDEVAYMLQFVQQLGGWGSSEGMDQLELPVEGYVAGARKDPIFARIEERIANVTGIPVHRHEDILSIFRISSHGDEPRGGYFPPFGLQHDSHERPHRAWTLMVYLQLPEEGGRRIFPLAGRPPKDGELAERHRHFTAALQDLFGSEAQNFSRRAFFDVRAEHPFMDLIEESCRGMYGASFLPLQPGAAILYPSHSRSFRTWTGGCNVIKGTKIVLQKFKEYPSERRGSDEPLPPYQPFVE